MFPALLVEITQVIMKGGIWLNVAVEGGAVLPVTGEKALHQIGTLIVQDAGSDCCLRVKKE